MKNYHIKPFIAVIIMLVLLLSILMIILPSAGADEQTGTTATNEQKNNVEIDTPHMLKVSAIEAVKPGTEVTLFDKDSLIENSLSLSIKDLKKNKQVTKELAVINQNTKKSVEYTVIISAPENMEEIFQEMRCSIFHEGKKEEADPQYIVISGTLEGSGTDIFQVEFSSGGIMNNETARMTVRIK